jgi:hypothetical protein
MTTELLINKDVSKQMKPFMTNVFLNAEKVSSPKTINIKQYLNISNFTVNNRHFVIKSSQATQL